LTRITFQDRTMPDFTRDAATIHYEIVGTGKPLLLIAGTASDGASWGPLLTRLPGRQLILIDNRGSGRTKVEGPLSHADMVEDCAALLDHLKLGSVDVVGHSLGGFLGMLLAADHPTKVERLVTMGTGIVDAKSKVMLQDLSRLYFTIAPEDYFRLLYQLLFSTPFFADAAGLAAAARASTDYPFRQSPGDFARQIAAMDNRVSLDSSTITCPVLAIAAEHDTLASPASVAAAHARIAAHKTTTIQDAAHSMHWEQPDAVAAAIMGFLGAK
jgi:pimeloyl-ACP methyl ester carboxylesterase